MAGVPKVSTFQLVNNGNQASQTCSISLALARPWLFKGFNADGSVTDITTAIEHYQIPVHL